MPGEGAASMCGVYSVCIFSFSLHAVLHSVYAFYSLKVWEKTRIYTVVGIQSLSFTLCAVLSYVSWSIFTLRSHCYYSKVIFLSFGFIN